MKIKLCLLFSLVLAWNVAQAQVRPIVYIGESIASLDKDYSFFGPEDADIVDGDGWLVGAGAEIGLKHNFALLPTLQLMKNKFTMNHTFPASSHFNLWQLKVPVLAIYKINIGKNFSLNVGAGPYASYRLNSDSDIGLKKMDFGLRGAGPDLKRMDFGFGVRLGAELFNHLVIGIEEDLGLRNLQDNPSYKSKYKSSCFSVSLGYTL